MVNCDLQLGDGVHWTTNTPRKHQLVSGPGSSSERELVCALLIFLSVQLYVLYSGPTPANTDHSPNAVSMLSQRQRRWTNIETELGEWSVFAGTYTALQSQRQYLLTFKVSRSTIYYLHDNEYDEIRCVSLHYRQHFYEGFNDDCNWYLIFQCSLLSVELRHISLYLFHLRIRYNAHASKWNESGFRPPLCTYRLNWARRTSWGWWDEWDDTVLQTQDSKFEPWRSEVQHATSRSRRLRTILTFTRGWGRNIFVSFKPSRPGTEPRTPAWKAAVLTTVLMQLLKLPAWKVGDRGLEPHTH